MAIDEQSLTQGLMEDLASARQRIPTQGPGDAMEYFEPKALRIQGKIVGQKEMARAERAFNNVIDDVIHNAGLLNNEEQFKLRLELKKKFQRYQQLVLKQTALVQKYLADKKLSAQQSQAIWAGVSSGISNLGTSIVGNMYNKRSADTLDALEAGTPGITAEE